ncbi:MAG: TIM barrel protein [Chloroflexi bacterium]|nr:TIM barrel protein [Chloroflexota bacterium]
MSIHVGTAPDSWGVWFSNDQRQTPWRRFLDEVKQAGYDSIELGPYGYLPTDTERLAGELAERSLKLAGGTLSGDFDAPDCWQAMRDRTAGVCDILAALGARYVVLLDGGYFDANGVAVSSRELDDSGWARTRDNLHRIGEYTGSRGIASVFHPHADTTIQYEPQIERLLELTDPALINLCLDVGHHAYAGGDAVRFFGEHHARVTYLHLKDVDAGIARRAREADWPFGRAVNAGGFVDLGDGCVDIVGINRVAERVGYEGWGIVEQDMFPAPFEKPLPIARRNREFLRANGIG